MREYRTSSRKGLYGIAAFLLLTAADQLSKLLAARFLKNATGLVLVPGVFELSYLENRGVAWGLFSGMRWLFLIAAVLVILFVCYLWRRLPDTASYRAFRALSVLFAAGAAGNAIDRLVRGYVIDFFYFSLIDFPVFNIADCYVCVSLILLVIIYRNEDFAWMKRS